MSTHRFVWSHSSLDEYQTCPFKFYRKRIAKDIADPPGPEAELGTKIHKAMEDNVRDGTPVPPSLPTYAALAERVRALPGDKHTELKMGIRLDLSGCDFFAQDVWGRAVADVLITVPGKDTAAVIDYKTGKYRGDNGQAARNAVGVFANFPEVNHVTTAFVYPNEDKVAKMEFRRDQLQVILFPTYQILGNISWSFDHGNWPKRPSGLCKKWCPVLDCEHNGRRR
jgi:hypothetical protein